VRARHETAAGSGSAPAGFAIYRLLAQTPGLTVVPHVTNVRGQTGVGIRSGTWKDSVYTIIFDRRTFAPLGMNWNRRQRAHEGHPQWRGRAEDRDR
jgi:hypothetical protein